MAGYARLEVLGLPEFPKFLTTAILKRCEILKSFRHCWQHSNTICFTNLQPKLKTQNFLTFLNDKVKREKDLDLITRMEMHFVLPIYDQNLKKIQYFSKF